MGRKARHFSCLPLHFWGRQFWAMLIRLSWTQVSSWGFRHKWRFALSGGCHCTVSLQSCQITPIKHASTSVNPTQSSATMWSRHLCTARFEFLKPWEEISRHLWWNLSRTPGLSYASLMLCHVSILLAFRNVWLYLGRRGATSFFRVSFSRNWCTEQNHAIYPPVWLPLGTSSPLSHAILQTLRCEWIRNMKKQRATFLRQETGWYAYRRLEAVLCIDLIHQHCSGSASALAKAGPWFPHPHYDTSPNRTRRFRRFGFVSNLLAPQDAATWEAVKAKGLAENFSFQGNHLI